MSKRRKRRHGMRGRFYKRMTPEEEVEQREAAFAAIRLLYAEVVPLWRSCARGHCRRHKQCCGDIRPCLTRAWPLTPPEAQNTAYAQVRVGGPRRLPPSTHSEWLLRRYAPSNFVH
jgi:hypothetical protein